MKLIFTSGRSSDRVLWQEIAEHGCPVIAVGVCPALEDLVTPEEREVLTSTIHPVFESKMPDFSSVREVIAACQQLYTTKESQVPDLLEISYRAYRQLFEKVQAVVEERYCALGTVLAAMNLQSLTSIVPGCGDYRGSGVSFVERGAILRENPRIVVSGGCPEGAAWYRFFPDWPEEQQALIKETLPADVLLSSCSMTGCYDVKANPLMEPRRGLDDCAARMIVDTARGSKVHTFFGKRPTLHCGDPGYYWVWQDAEKDVSQLTLYQAHGKRLQLSGILTKRQDTYQLATTSIVDPTVASLFRVYRNLVADGKTSAANDILLRHLLPYMDEKNT